MAMEPIGRSPHTPPVRGESAAPTVSDLEDFARENCRNARLGHVVQVDRAH